jgi:putative transposase
MKEKSNNNVVKPAQSRSQTGAPKRPQRSIPPYNPGLHQLVQSKRAWAVPLDADAKAKGFLGWHQRGYLPHYDAPGVTQIITLRLADSLPASRRGEWEHLLRIDNHREHRRKLEEFLDRGLGDCWLRQPAIAALAEGALRFFDGQRYALTAWVVMPNHLHALVDIWDMPLSELIKSWKSFVAREANKRLGRRGEFWEREYLDTVIENDSHHRTAVRYIENNPVKAGLAREVKDWPWSSARFRDEFGRLKYPDEQSRSQTGAPQEEGATTCSRLKPEQSK